MTEVVRKGIREAELELLKANDEKLMEEVSEFGLHEVQPTNIDI